MLFRPVHPDPNFDPIHDPGEQAEDARLYRDILQELMHIGTDLARLLHQQAIAHAQATLQGLAPTTPPRDHASAFDRITRAIRRTITLTRSLAEPAPPAPDHTARPRTAARTPTLRETGEGATGHLAASGQDYSAEAPDEAPSAGLRDRPEAPDHDAPDHDAPDRDAPDRDAPDRDRDAPDRDEDITGRPPAEVIAEIRRDLGLDAPPGAHTRTAPIPAGTGQPSTPAAAPSGATASAPCQPGPGPQASWPQRPGYSTVQHLSDPQPDGRDLTNPTAIPHLQPSPVHPGCTLPDRPAEQAATVQPHAAHDGARWRPPPEG